MKKDLDWLAQRIHSEREQLSQSWLESKETDVESVFNDGRDDALSNVLRLIDQLDEPEVLSQEWIDEHSNGASRSQYVWVDDLKNLLVPKQEDMFNGEKPDEREQLETAYKDILSRGEFLFDDKRYVVVEKEPETIASVLVDFFKAAERLKEIGAIEVEELEE